VNRRPGGEDPSLLSPGLVGVTRHGVDLPEDGNDWSRLTGILLGRAGNCLPDLFTVMSVESLLITCPSIINKIKSLDSHIHLNSKERAHSSRVRSSTGARKLSTESRTMWCGILALDGATDHVTTTAYHQPVLSSSAGHYRLLTGETLVLWLLFTIYIIGRSWYCI